MTPGWRLFLATFGLLWAIKSLVVWRKRPGLRPFAWLAYFLVWPGVDPAPFRIHHPEEGASPRRFFRGWLCLWMGLLSILTLAILAPSISAPTLGLAGIAALLLTIHLGIGEVLPWALRWIGFPVGPLFDAPLASRSLTEFWSRRWNLAFVEMNRILLLRPLLTRLPASAAAMTVFAISGLLHEVAISFPAGGGWGWPFGYFLLHGVLVLAERKWRIESRLWTWFWLAAPTPLLFHEAFRDRIIVPLYLWLHQGLAAHSFEEYLSLALHLASAGNLLILVASVQVPSRLGWKDDVAQLRPFNRKIFWVYGFYILFCIIGFAAATFWLHDSLLTGEQSARAIALFIALFWSLRVVTTSSGTTIATGRKATPWPSDTPC